MLGLLLATAICPTPSECLPGPVFGPYSTAESCVEAAEAIVPGIVIAAKAAVVWVCLAPPADPDVPVS